jgi:hydroxymethylpyrimidine/phosphomethylpyrimidine kinase
VCLAVGGSDPSGGAGIQADLKVFHGHGVYGAAAVGLLTVQDTRGVRASRVQDPEFVAAQVEAVLSDLPVAAVKTGALGNGAVAGAVARALEGWKGFLVVDPVVLPKSGAPLSDLGDLDGFRPLFARADLLLPNLDEAALLLGRPVGSAEEMPGAADELKERFGSEAVLLKGGHLAGPETVDHLRTAEGTWTWRSPRIVSHHTHGTGCALASSIAARWALGRPLPVAVEEGREWLRRAIGQAPGLGSGNGPLDLFA